MPKSSHETRNRARRQRLEAQDRLLHASVADAPKRREQALAPANLARAKAVCKLPFEGPPVGWQSLSVDAKMEACIHLALEFKDDVWAGERMGSLFRQMLKMILKAHNRERHYAIQDKSGDGSDVEPENGCACYCSARRKTLTGTVMQPLLEISRTVLTRKAGRKQ
jgi:hypothetical protein